MIKRTLAVVGLTLSLTPHAVNAAILSLDSSFGSDTITRDTDTGLDWLDVTVTRGLSYNQVTAELGAGGTYEGYRYATMAELDALIVNFGYIAQTTQCTFNALHCDTGNNVGGQHELIETMIRTLGDTYVAAGNSVAADGAGQTIGILGTSNIDPSTYDMALIIDQDRPEIDVDDGVQTAWSRLGPTTVAPAVGSFLVSEVPLPAAGWLFISALIGLAGKTRLSRRSVD